MQTLGCGVNRNLNADRFVQLRSRTLLVLGFLLCLMCVGSFAQQPDEPVVVQPGAPGRPTRTLPASTRAILPPTSTKDVEFMQGMIMHHAQAVEMTALIDARTETKELRLLGARISHSQGEEMRFMANWLRAHGDVPEMQMPKTAAPQTDRMNMTGMSMTGADRTDKPMLMPGMLTAKQIEALGKARGKSFDRLFLEGMIQHHNGALVMVRELFESAGSGQDAELFNFVTDVDSGQRAEIRIMQNMLGQKP